MNLYKIEYKNLNEFEGFVCVKDCLVHQKNDIILLDYRHNQEYNGFVSDDFGYDKIGPHVLVSWNSWYDNSNGKKIDTQEVDVHDQWDRYINVSCTIKIYTKIIMRACYIEQYPGRTLVNFIPYNLLHFSGSDTSYKLIGDS